MHTNSETNTQKPPIPFTHARVKGIGGAVGLTENGNALRRWMVAGPEVARVVSDFEMAAGNIFSS